MPENKLRESNPTKAFSNKGNEVVHYEDGVDVTLIRWMFIHDTYRTFTDIATKCTIYYEIA